MGGSASLQQVLPSISIDGVGSLGNFDKFSGGETSTSITKHRPGGMGPEVSYLGLPVYSNASVSRVYEEERDNALVAQLRLLSGNTYATIICQWLDDDGNPFGTPTTYRGRIEGVSDTGADSTSSTPREYTVEVCIETVAN